MLARLGYAPGSADGRWGRRSVEAYQNFLRDIGMAPSDELTLDALHALRRMARDARSAAADVTRLPDVPLHGSATAETTARTELPSPGFTFRDCETCPEMVVVPAGSFRMGSTASEAGRDDEGPVHRVTIAKPFAVGKYEVTVSEWEVCAEEGWCSRVGGSDGQPVVNVSWYDAGNYVRWLSLQTGESYRLLSEAEWEYAARAGTQTRYAWGDDIGRNRANCQECGSRWDGTPAAPVGSFSPNAYGLHDLHGNVSEWVDDCWHQSYAGAPSDGETWRRGQGNCAYRTVRGGAGTDIPENVRSAVRDRNAVGKKRDDLGFRVARTLGP